MDTRFQALLNHYHARMADEDRLMKSDPAGVSRRRDEFLLAVGPEVGRLLHALIIGRGAKRILELGTSYGYSTAFLADAARETGGGFTPWISPPTNSSMRERSSRRPAAAAG